jgi:hypothetical protein
MIYKYDKKQLIFKKDFKTLKISILVVTVLSAFSFIYGRYTRIESLDPYEKELIVLNMQVEKNKFTEEKLVKILKDLNVKFPHIVLAQSMVETGHWNSKIFKENHNLFGMKQARSRITTATGTQHNHAFYETWTESVYDYAFYQCRYLGSIKTEAEYFNYLSKSYAEDPNYIVLLKKTVENNNLKEIFK